MRKDIEKMIREQPMFLHRAGWTYHPPTLDEQGKFRLGFPEHCAYIELCKRFYDAGVRIFLSNLPVGWIDEDAYDFRSMDETLEKFFSVLPDAYYIPRLRLDPPFAWMEKHPEEVCVFSDGPTDPLEIKKLVEEGRVNNTYDMTKEPRPNGLQPLRLEEPIGLQSFSSKLWVKDACKALEATIKHILEGPYKDRFVGFHICFGGTCELLHWGNGGSKIGDFSIKHTKAFFEWALKKYGTLQELRKMWHKPNLTYENAFVPSPAHRASIDEPGSEVINRDYALFHSQTVKDAFLELAKTSKRLAPDLAVGVFYGYEEYGHEHLDDILASPYVDYLSAPKPYLDPQPGGKGGSVPKVASIMRKKTFIEEIDNRPHTAWDPRKFASHINVEPAKNLMESANVLWREVCKLEQVNASWWWMDQGDAKHRWYDDDELMSVVADQLKVHSALRNNSPKSISEVLLISDTAANYYHAGFGVFIRSELLYSGIPFDEYRMSDVGEIDLSKYKLLIFRKSALMTKEKLNDILSRISSDCQIMFVDLPSTWGENTLNNVFELTAMKLRQNQKIEDGQKVFNVVSGADENILEDETGVRIARKGNIWLMLYNKVNAQILIDLIKRCGVKSIINSMGVVHGNSKLLGVFSTKHNGIDSTVSLPAKGDWYEWFTKTDYLNTDKVSINIAPREARVFISKDLL